MVVCYVPIHPTGKVAVNFKFLDFDTIQLTTISALEFGGGNRNIVSTRHQSFRKLLNYLLHTANAWRVEFAAK